MKQKGIFAQKNVKNDYLALHYSDFSGFSPIKTPVR